MNYQKNFQNPYTLGQTTSTAQNQDLENQNTYRQQQQQIPIQQVNPPIFGGQPNVTGAYNPAINVYEVSFIENILRLNKGKLGTFYYTFTDSLEWRDRIFKGVVEAAGRDHIIISDPKTGKRYLLLMIYLNWVEFDEELAYEYPF